MTSIIKIVKPAILPQPQPMMRPRACQHCPSTNHPPDPECVDIRAATKKERIETAFACAWDRDFFCRGYCLYMGISNVDLASRVGDCGQ